MSLLITAVACAQEVHVTGRAWEVNGQSAVPRALFGVHATPMTPEEAADWGVESVRFISQQPGKPTRGGAPPVIGHLVECFWDRYQPALIVEHADWADKLRIAATRYGEASLGMANPPVVEFWNEPYLNWGVRPGVNYDGRFYRDEGRAEGGRMTLRYEDLPTHHLRWTRQLVAARSDNGAVDYLASRYMPAGLRAGGHFSWRNREYRVTDAWWGRDITQETFWPGEQNVGWYIDMLKVFAPALKAANPDLTLIAGWDFHIHQDNYAAWENVHRPTIDAGMPWIDGYTEHHYGGDTRYVAAAYETTSAYTASRHGKVLGFYNTEAGGELDPERPGPAQPGYNVTPPEVRARGGLTYMVRDILYLLAHCPDKAKARAAHEANQNRGVIAAFRLLKPLRGRLMETHSPQAQLWSCAALEGQRLTVALFHDGREAGSFPLRVDAPAGATISRMVLRRVDESMAVVENGAAVGGTSWTGSIALGTREAAVLEFTLGGSPDPALVRSRQWFSPAMFQGLAADASVDATITLEAPLAADAATLRLIQHGLKADTHRVEFNGHALELPTLAGVICDLPVDPAWLAAENQIRVGALAGAGKAQIESLSLFLHTRSPSP